MKLKQTGSVFINHGLWYYAVQLPGEKRRRQVPLRAPGANHTLTADRPRKMAEDAAARYWQENTRQIVRHEPTGATVEEICERWAVHAREYYHGESSAVNAVLDVRLFREMFGRAALAELTHADMLKLRDALIRSGLARRTVNSRLWRVKFMLEWALDEALIPAVVKAELTQVKGVKRGRSAARETPPVHPIDDATVEATLACLTPNTADMVRVQRLSGMRPCELCAMRWALIDRPKARQILEKYRGGDAPFSPVRAMTEYLAAKRAARATPFYGKRKGAPEPSVPREIGDAWDVHAYRRAIARACDRAKIHSWGPNRLRHTFGTEVRRRFGLEACRAVLGHTMGGCVTDIYSFGAIEDEMIEKASPAVEALG